MAPLHDFGVAHVHLCKSLTLSQEPVVVAMAAPMSMRPLPRCKLRNSMVAMKARRQATVFLIQAIRGDVSVAVAHAHLLRANSSIVVLVPPQGMATAPWPWRSHSASSCAQTWRKQRSSLPLP
jgi:hypothetical protein